MTRRLETKVMWRSQDGVSTYMNQQDLDDLRELFSALAQAYEGLESHLKEAPGTPALLRVKEGHLTAARIVVSMLNRVRSDVDEEWPDQIDDE